VAERTIELERSNKELEQFAYVASHDLQEPLRHVMAFGELLRQRYRERLDEKGQVFLGHMVEGAQRMSELVRALLEYSRAGRGDRPPESVSAAEVVKVALADLRLPIEESSAVVTCGPLPWVLCDRVGLRQLFQNLLGNAIKFRRDGAAPRIEVGGRTEDGTCTLWVKDNGIGIPADLREKAFVIFQRLHGEEKYSGTGIGLAVCQKIVERHGGRIWVESAVGEGSTFFFTLPPAKGAEA